MSRALLIVIALAACSKRNTSTTTTTGPTGNGTGTTNSDPGTGTGPGTGTSTGTQTPPPFNSEADCPAIQVKAPDSVSQGTKARVAATLVGGTGTPTYKWTVSAGSVASGQGTAVITVDTSGLKGTSVVATLEIGGVPTQCATTSATATLLVGP
ncbi:MAG: hypothetical protein H0T46_31380 [Deltaproteobacteria bacterium]|nr:hypothetical protein [Deltaproteobacteria bacterium]